MVKVILIGMGHLGKWHVDKANELSEAELVAVIDPNTDTPNKLIEKKIKAKWFQDLDSCQLEYDAAIVASPTSLHFQLCEALLNKGKHIFCEKPVTSTYEQALTLEKLASKKGVVFQVGHSERFHLAWEKLLERSEYFRGQPIYHLERQAPFKGRATDVDVVQDLMIHDLDLLLYITNEMPEKVTARGKKIRTDKWDYAEAELHFASGAYATVRVGRNYTEEVRKFEIHNQAGCIQVDLFKREIIEASALAKEESAFVTEAPYPARDHLLEEQRAFYRAIMNEGEVPVNLADGRKAVYLVEKVLTAIESGSEETC